MEGKTMTVYGQWAAPILGQIREKMAWSSEKNRDKIPYTTDAQGSYIDCAAGNDCGGLGWWTNGFWGGTMWLLYQDTGDESYRRIAQASEDRLSRCFDFFYDLSHDVGFQFQPTAVADYRLTGREESRKRGLHAASLLAGRFNPAGNFIRAWNNAWPGADVRGWAIIDCMCNLPLLYWASQETDDPRFRHIAMLHADTAARCFLRADGSVRHIVEFDPETGAYIRSHGGQGYGHGSAWSRGQAWAVYGFALSYRYTKKQAYLDASKKVADYVLAHLPESGLVPCDFMQPAEPAWEDSCGAAILASGIWELAEVLPDGGEKERYRQGAWRIADALYRQRTDWTHSCDAIVQNCTAAYHDEKHHFPMSYADYYFIEAVYKMAGKNYAPW